MRAFRTITRNGPNASFYTFRPFSIESSNPSLQSVFSSYKSLAESKDRYDSIVQCFDSKVKGSKYEVINYLNRAIGAISLAELIRRDIRSNLKIKYLSSLSPAIVSVNFLDSILKEWLDTVMCEDALELQEITFESSSGYMLQKIMQGEAVHAYKNMSELSRRLCPGRHCYALVHHSMPNDPIAFTHVALTENIVHIMSELKYTTKPKCAIFYSVNSPYNGYSGLDLAGRLIDRVTAKLKHDYPFVETFCTLSPLPSFITWLKSLMFKSNKVKEIMKAMPERLKTELIALTRVHGTISSLYEFTSNPVTTPAFDDETAVNITDVVVDSNKNKSPGSHGNRSDDKREEQIDSGLHWLIKTVASMKRLRNDSMMADIKEVMLWLGCYYITKEFKGVYKLPADEVARFHMRRGASFHRLNWAANESPLSMESSGGIMVNYLYDVPQSLVVSPSTSCITADLSLQTSSSSTVKSTTTSDNTSSTLSSFATSNDDVDNIEFLRKFSIEKRLAIARENFMKIPLGKQVIDILNDRRSSIR